LKIYILFNLFREIAKLYSGDAFGELGLLLNEDRTATAVCVEKC
jgi:CRP-like cAMP-binding protein